MIWPPELARLRHTAALEEVASTLRHTALNDLAGVGALAYRLRRRLESAGAAADPDVAGPLDAIDARIAAAPARLGARFLSGADRTARAEVGAALAALLAATGVTAAVTTPQQPCWVAVDAGELQVTLACLIENAAEAVAAAGRGAITVTCKPVGANVIIDISDDAEALAPTRAERMFDPLFSTRPGHAGLGLKIARSLAHRWDGELLVTPCDPAGLQARLEFPAAPA